MPVPYVESLIVFLELMRDAYDPAAFWCNFLKRCAIGGMQEQVIPTAHSMKVHRPACQIVPLIACQYAAFIVDSNA